MWQLRVARRLNRPERENFSRQWGRFRYTNQYAWAPLVCSAMGESGVHPITPFLHDFCLSKILKWQKISDTLQVWNREKFFSNGKSKSFETFIVTTFFFNDTKTVPSIRFYRDKLSTQTLLFRKGVWLNFLNLLFGRGPTTESGQKPTIMSNFK